MHDVDIILFGYDWSELCSTLPISPICCLVGQRPGIFSSSKQKELLKAEIEKAIADGFRVFITGATGKFDALASEIVYGMKKDTPRLHLMASVPFKKFRPFTSNYSLIMQNSEVRQFFNNYSIFERFNKADKWMIDESKRVITYCNGRKGRISNIIKYANEKNVYVINLYDKLKNGCFTEK